MSIFKDKRIMWIFIYILALLVVCVVGIVGTAWYFKFQPNLPFGIATLLNPILPPSSFLQIDNPDALPSPDGKEAFIPSLRKTSTQNGTLYIIRGSFVEKPVFTNDLLIGKFVIADDPNKTSIPVLMTARTGSISVGRFTKSLDGNVSWKSEKTPVLASLLDSGKPCFEVQDMGWIAWLPLGMNVVASR